VAFLGKNARFLFLRDRRGGYHRLGESVDQFRIALRITEMIKQHQRQKT
jgi:hypothetical protein